MRYPHTFMSNANTFGCRWDIKMKFTLCTDETEVADKLFIWDGSVPNFFFFGANTSKIIKTSHDFNC